LLRFLIVALATAALAGCATVAPRTKSAPLFSDAMVGNRLDFETQTLGRAPDGFAGDTAEFAVADSPSAASGELVVVHRGGKAASLTLPPKDGGTAVRGEAAVRVLVGEPGAGVGCEAADGSGYLVRVEPEAKRVALYERTAGDLKLIGESPSTVGKGTWVRLGIQCGRGQVTSYRDGAEIAGKRAEVEPSTLALHADADVTAQFDDVVVVHD
jgi:hypothetical protein